MRLLKRLINHVVHQRRFAGAGNAGDRDHHVQRNGDVDALQVVRLRAQETGSRVWD